MSIIRTDGYTKRNVYLDPKYLVFFFRDKGLGSLQNVISPEALTCSGGIRCQWSKIYIQFKIC